MNVMGIKQGASLLERKALRIVLAGFALVIVLLLTAAIGAVNSARAIRQTADQLAREQLTVVQLVNELQLEQSALGSLAHRYFVVGEPMDRAQLTQVLTQMDDLLGQVLEDSAIASDRASWQDLRVSAEQFSEQARKVADAELISSEAMSSLFEAHSRILADVSNLMEASSQRTADAESRISTKSEEALVSSLLWLGSAALLSAICAVVTARAEVRLFSLMRRQQNELSRVSWSMLQSQETILRRFSHELHDDLGQSLAAIRSVVEHIGPERLEQSRDECLILVDGAVENVRELSQLLRPVILDDFGLSAALDWLGERFGERTRVEWQYSSELIDRLSDEVETHLFRITQEALTNIARHSQASIVRVRLWRNEGEAILRIADNGRGIDETRPASDSKVGLGLVGMRARAEQMGANLFVGSSAGGGVTIEVTVPLANADIGA